MELTCKEIYDFFCNEYKKILSYRWKKINFKIYLRESIDKTRTEIRQYKFKWMSFDNNNIYLRKCFRGKIIKTLNRKNVDCINSITMYDRNLEFELVNYNYARIKEVEEMITKQEYGNAVKLIEQYRREQDLKKKKDSIEEINPKVLEVIEELKKLDYKNYGERNISKYFDTYCELKFIKNDIILYLYFTKKEIKFNLWFNNKYENRLDIIEFCTVENLKLTIENIEKVIAKIECQWKKLAPIMEKYNIKRWKNESLCCYK